MKTTRVLSAELIMSHLLERHLIDMKIRIFPLHFVMSDLPEFNRKRWPKYLFFSTILKIQPSVFKMTVKIRFSKQLYAPLLWKRIRLTHLMPECNRNPMTSPTQGEQSTINNSLLSEISRTSFFSVPSAFSLMSYEKSAVRSCIYFPKHSCLLKFQSVVISD